MNRGLRILKGGLNAITIMTSPKDGFIYRPPRHIGKLRLVTQPRDYEGGDFIS